MKTVLLTIALICMKNSWGQIAYRPIPETNAVWIQTSLFTGGSHEYETTVSAAYTLGDTVISGQTYIQFGSHGMYKWADNWGSQQNYSEGGGSVPYTAGYFRQDVAQKKVFIWNSTNQTDELLYDFGSLVIGQPYPETVTNLYYPNLLVMAQDSVQLIDGNYYKRWVLGTNSSDSAYVSVIEGVGGTNGFNTPIYGNFEQFSRLLCHKSGVQSIYENWQTYPASPEFSEDCSRTLSIGSHSEVNATIFPNPSSSAITVQSDRSIHFVELFDLNGKLLLRDENWSNSSERQLDLRVLEQGVYLIGIVFTDGNMTTQQIHLIK